jgi:hypothetical protein
MKEFPKVLHLLRALWLPFRSAELPSTTNYIFHVNPKKVPEVWEKLF